MRSLTGGSAGLRDAFGQTGSRFGKSCSVLGEPLLANLLGDCAPKAIAAKFGREKYHKRPRNIGDNAGGPGAVAWVDPPAVRQKASKNARVYRFLLRTENNQGRAFALVGSGPSTEMGYPSWGRLVDEVVKALKKTGQISDEPSFLSDLTYCCGIGILASMSAIRWKEKSEPGPPASSRSMTRL